jgi:hypothetical protein
MNYWTDPRGVFGVREWLFPAFLTNGREVHPGAIGIDEVDCLGVGYGQGFAAELTECGAEALGVDAAVSGGDDDHFNS